MYEVIFSVLSCAAFSQVLDIQDSFIWFRFFCAFVILCDFNCHLTLSNQNQIFLHTRCITLKQVTSLRGPFLGHFTQATLFLSKKCCRSVESLATLSDLTGPKFELPLQRRLRYRSTNWPVI